METTLVVPLVAIGGVLVNAGIAWAAVSRIEGMDERLRKAEQGIAALRAYNGLPTERG